MADIKDLINSVLEKNPVDFNSIFSEIIHERAIERLQDERISVADRIYNGVEESVDEDDLEDIDFDDLEEIDEEILDELSE